MKKYFIKRNKYLIASTGLFIGTLATNSLFIQSIGASALLYNYFERIGFIDTDLHPDMVKRRIILSE